MPRTSFKYRVSQEVSELLGIGLLLDLCFSDSGNDNPEVETNLIKVISESLQVLEPKDSHCELLTSEVQELFEALLVALPNIRYLAPREPLTRGLGFWSNVCMVAGCVYGRCIGRGRQEANLYVLI